MTRDDIIRIAEENGIVIIGEAMFRFAALVAAAEREACAKVCDEQAEVKEQQGTWLWEARRCAAAIRARGAQ